MSRTRAFYAVVQYVPDGGRAEAANAGVVQAGCRTTLPYTTLCCRHAL